MVKVLICFCLLATSCSGHLVRRRGGGQQVRPQALKQFAGIKKRIALLTFFNEAPYGGEDLGIVAAEELRLELARSGEFVVDPMAKKIFGNSKEVYAGGGLKLVQLARKGKGAGINFVLFGRIGQARIREKRDEIGIIREVKSYSEAKVEVRLFDVNSSKEIHTQTVIGRADDSTYRLFGKDRKKQLAWRRQLLRYAVRVAIRQAIPKVLEISRRMDWTGRVAKIIGNKIYVNAGRKSGMRLGDILRVVTEGQEIYDPETGALIGVSKGETKGTIEVIDYFGPDGSIAVLHSGGAVLEGDFVQLY